MKFEIKHRLSGELLFSIETDTWKLAIEAAIKAKADLRSADLSWADLRSANLRSAKTDHRFISISGIGSQKRMTIYDLTDDKIFCGCFIVTLKEFEKSVNKTHAGNKQYLAEYMGFIKYVRGLKEQ